ncbi:hypothetical protein [Chryseobacterium caseinilyticum]|uniref:Uncharacterized protein n=1 Tax=Chryseobacterium caseinilyticum TaxID=2771428 RepID=A0ABR8ZG80_9FLAO|nr:hypothetical protein [Chryseobacterium caseinilyticum]MBD8084294.1 hypothetical protein [Chryseobacterium caseinilyticum]
MIKSITVLILLTLGHLTFGQELILPPVSMEKDDVKIALMNKFIEVSNYEKSLKKYVSEYLWLHSEELKLTDVQEEQIKKIFDYKTIAQYFTYSSLKRVENDKISKLNDFYTAIDGSLDKEHSIFISNYYYCKLLNDNILMYVKHTKKKNK